MTQQAYKYVSLSLWPRLTFFEEFSDLREFCAKPFLRILKDLDKEFPIRYFESIERPLSINSF